MREEQQKALSERVRRDDPDDDEDREERPVLRRDRMLEPPAFRLFDFGN